MKEAKLSAETRFSGLAPGISYLISHISSNENSINHRNHRPRWGLSNRIPSE
jgi:hypothetical protein